MHLRAAAILLLGRGPLAARVRVPQERASEPATPITDKSEN